MNVFRLLTRSSEPADIPNRSITGRYIASPKTQRRLSKKADIELGLAVYNAITPAELRKAETDAWFAAVEKAVGR